MAGIVSLRAAFEELMEHLEREFDLREDECDPTISVECGYLQAALDVVNGLYNGASDLGIFADDEEAEHAQI